MDLQARQKVNASACSARDISASLNWKVNTLEIQLLCLQEQGGKRTLNTEEPGKEKSSLVGTGFHRSYFEFP